jgi:hypothetical protein
MEFFDEKNNFALLHCALVVFRLYIPSFFHISYKYKALHDHTLTPRDFRIFTNFFSRKIRKEILFLAISVIIDSDTYHIHILRIFWNKKIEGNSPSSKLFQSTLSVVSAH